MPVEVPTNLIVQGLHNLSLQPFSAMLETFALDNAELSIPVAPALLQQHGFTHGGVLSYLADNALTFSGGLVLDDSVTSEFKMNSLRPAKDAEHLLAVATVVGSGKTQAVCRDGVYHS